MKRNYYLITNVMGLQYWSYLVTIFTAEFENDFICEAVKKYGEIFVNRNGGWFTEDSIRSVDRIVMSDRFPPE